MKKILLYTMLLVTGILAGCDKDEEAPLFDDPDKRLTAVLADYRSTLVSAPDGWKATIFPKGGRGYSFYIDFDENGRVTMLSDFNATTASTLSESSFRLKALQRPTLIFDTYTYIHLIADPNETVNGGTRGKGLDSDFEFAFIEVTDARIKLEGTFNKNEMVMERVTAEEAASYRSGSIQQLMTATNQYLTANRNPFIQFSDGIRQSVSIVPASKTITLSYVDEADVSKTVSSPYSYTLTGIYLKQPLTYGSIAIQELFWDNDTKVYYAMVDGARIDLQNSATPIIPLRVLVGFGKEYSMMEYNPATITTPLSADFVAKYNAAVSGLALVGNANRRLNYIRVMFTNDNTMVLRFFYNNAAGTNFMANMTYEMTRTASGELDFRYLSSDGNATAVGAGLVSLRDYFDTNNFRIDWVINPNAAAPLGGLYVVNNPASFFYGTLIK